MENIPLYNFIIIVALLFFAKFLLRFIVRRTLRLVDDGDDTTRSMAEKRADTLSKTLVAVGNTVIYAIIFVMLLNLFGVDIRPILAGLGIIGLAVGFGAQSLVKDFVSGIFILLENQYMVGERVKIGSFEGEVVKVSMRSTVLKNGEGALHYITNGSVNNVTNYSRKVKIPPV